jgi:hypothetical protein
MKLVLTASVLVATVIMFLGGIGIGYAITRDEPPPPPAWVNPDGSIDPAKVPAKIWVVDSTGKRVGYVDGSSVFAPPPPPGTTSTSSGLPVKNEAGEVVGAMVPQKGFVPLNSN